MKKFVKKLISGALIAAVTATFAVTAVGAVTPQVLRGYSVPLDRDQEFCPTDFFHAYYQSYYNAWGVKHDPRTQIGFDTNFDSKSKNGVAVARMFYDKGAQKDIETKREANGCGWIETRWLYPSPKYTAVTQLAFHGKRYDNRGKLTDVYTVYVN